MEGGQMIVLLACFILSTCVSRLQAQDFCGEFQNPIDQTGESSTVLTFDRFGNTYSYQQLLYPAPNALQGGGNNVCVAGLFTLHFEDVMLNTGTGFADPTFGTARCVTLCQMFRDLSDLFLDANPANPGRVHLLIQSGASAAISPVAQGQLPPNALAAATGFNILPLGASGAMIQSEIYKTIVYGENSYTFVPAAIWPSQAGNGLYHGLIRYNFQASWDADPNNQTPANEFDLYSVSLHEAYHLLGIASNIGQDGTPKFMDCFFHLDRHLFLDNNTALISQGANGWFYTGGLNDLRANCNTGPIRFTGVAAGNIPSYSPLVNAWSNGSNLSHFSCSEQAGCGPYALPGNDFIIAYCSAGGANYDKMHPNQAEVSALCDLGYSLRTNVNGLAEYGVQAQLNIRQTYTTCAPQCNAIAFMDFEQTGFDQTINFDPTANDDINVTGIAWLHMNTPNAGVATFTGTNVEFNPSAAYFGFATLSYAPLCGNGDIGEPAIIVIRVENPILCTDDGQCNLVCLGTFEETPFSIAWSEFNVIGHNQNSPDILEFTPPAAIQVLNANGIPAPPLQNYPFSCMAVPPPPPPPLLPEPTILNNFHYIQISGCSGEAIKLQLREPLLPGVNYDMSFWAAQMPPGDFESIRIIGSTTPPCPPPFHVDLTPGAVSSCGTYNFEAVDLSGLLPVNANGWNQINFAILPINVQINHLIISENYSNAQNIATFTLLDEIRIERSGVADLKVTPEPLTLSPCLNVPGEITYTICSDANPPTAAVQLHVDIPNGYMVNQVVGGFDANGDLTLPAGTFTGYNCVTVTLSVTAIGPFTVGAPYQFPLIIANGAACWNGNNENYVTLLARESPVELNKSWTELPNGDVQFSIEACNTEAAILITLSDVLPTLPAGYQWNIVNPNGFTLVNGAMTQNINLPAGTPMIPYCQTFSFTANVGGAVHQYFHLQNCAEAVSSDPNGPPICAVEPSCVDFCAGACPNGQFNVGQPGVTTQLSQLTMPTGPSCITVDGILDINVAYTCPPGTTFMMRPGSEIQISSPANFTNVTFGGCEEMWHGFRLLINSANTFLTLNNCVVRDALFAIEVHHGVKLSVQNTTFERNFLGLYSPPSGTQQIITFMSPFVGNTFDGAADLLLPFANMAALLPFRPDLPPGTQVGLGDRPYSAIYLNNVLNLTIGNSNASQPVNLIRNFPHGILLRQNTTIAIRRTQFQNILTDMDYLSTTFNGTAIYGWGDANQIHYLNYLGMGETANSPIAFNNCQNGVGVDFMRVLVRESRLEAIRTWGLRALNCRTRRVEFLFNRITSRIGIILNNIADPASNNVDVFQNNIFITDSRGIGINVQENGLAVPAATTYRIRNNHVFMGGAQQGATGISLTNANGLEVRENEVTLHGFAPGPPNHFKAGLFVEGCFNCRFNCNEVLLTAGNTIETHALHVTLSQNNSFTDNEFNSTSYGARFVGDCDNSRLRLNRFIQNNIGLSVNFMIGRQPALPTDPLNGNQWIGPFGTCAVEHESNDPAIVLGSQFFANPNVANNWPPTNCMNGVPFNNFFAQSANCTLGDPLCTPPDFTCATYPLMAQQGGGGNFSSKEQLTAQGQLPVEEYPLETTWMAEKLLYEKIQEEGNPLNDPLYGGFETELQPTVIGGLYEVKNASKIAERLSEADKLQWEAHTTSFESVATAISQKEDELGNAMDENEVNQIVADRDLLYQQLSEISAETGQLMQGLEQPRLAALNAAATGNAQIGASALYEENEKAVNQIYLGTWGIGRYLFSELEKVTLEFIANQCPLSGGHAVYRARTMLLALEPLLSFADYDVCSAQGLQFRRDAEQTETALKVPVNCQLYPNPAQESAVLEFSAKTESELTILFYSATGTLVSQTVVPAGALRSQISLKNMPSGLYALTLFENGTLLWSGTLSVMKP